MFVYTIEDNVAYINYLKDSSITSVEIPRLIGGCAVKFPGTLFEGCSNLEHINGVRIKEGVNIINNTYLCIDKRKESHYLRSKGLYLMDMSLGKILYNINDDYAYNLSSGVCYIVDDVEYFRNFIKCFMIEG